MTVADTLVTRFSLQDDFSPKAGKVQASARGVTASMVGITSSGSGMAGVAAGAAILAAGFGALASTAKDATEAVFGLSVAAAEFERLTLSLEAVEGSADGATRAMRDLKALSMAPGIGLEQAISGYTKLRNAGVEQDFTKTLIREIANANARGGGNKETFSRAILAISQIAGNQFLQGDELNQLAEANIPARRMIRQAFGTSDTEELKRMGVTTTAVLAALALEMSKTERVAGGMANSFDNIGDSLQYMRVQAGEGVNSGLKPIADEIGRIADIAVKGEVFKSIGNDIANIFDVDTSGMESFLINFVSAFKTGLQLVDMIIEQLKPLFPFLTTGGAIGAALDPMFQANRREVEMQFELGRKRSEREAATPVSTATQEALQAMAEDRSFEQVADNTSRLVKIEEERLRLDQRIIGGGAFGTAAVNPVKISQAISGTLPAGASKGEAGMLKALRMWAAELAEEQHGVKIRSRGYGRATG